MLLDAGKTDKNSVTMKQALANQKKKSTVHVQNHMNVEVMYVGLVNARILAIATFAKAIVV